MPRNYYVSGGWNVICDSCGKKIKASEAKQRWDGLIVCPADFEMRQPQDFVKARADKITVPFTRPRPTDVFILTQGVYDPVPVVDSLVANSTYIRHFSDTVGTTDSLVRTLGFNESDNITADDGSDRYIDPTYFASDYVGSNYYGGVAIFFGKSQSDVTTAVDLFARKYDITVDDSATLLEYVMDAYSKQTSDTVGLADSMTALNRILQKVDDTLTVSDLISFVSTFNTTLSDTTSLADNADVYKAIPVSVADSQTISDLALVSEKPSKSDSATVADSGNIFYNNYIDPTYFASNYVGTNISI